MQRAAELYQEAHEALQRVWFVQSVEETERTDDTLSLRLVMRESGTETIAQISVAR